jgi:hypothetical protein
MNEQAKKQMDKETEGWIFPAYGGKQTFPFGKAFISLWKIHHFPLGKYSFPFGKLALSHVENKRCYIKEYIIIKK